MALTFLLVLLTLATLCTRLHRNFRRGESIYWEPTVDSRDTVAAVLKRRLLMPPRRVKRSRRRPSSHPRRTAAQMGTAPSDLPHPCHCGRSGSSRWEALRTRSPPGGPMEQSCLSPRGGWSGVWFAGRGWGRGRWNAKEPFQSPL